MIRMAMMFSTTLIRREQSDGPHLVYTNGIVMCAFCAQTWEHKGDCPTCPMTPDHDCNPLPTMISYTDVSLILDRVKGLDARNRIVDADIQRRVIEVASSR